MAVRGVEVAQALAKFVKDNDLDGVDSDFEQLDRIATPDGIDWMISQFWRSPNFVSTTCDSS